MPLREFQDRAPEVSAAVEPQPSMTYIDREVNAPVSVEVEIIGGTEEMSRLPLPLSAVVGRDADAVSPWDASMVALRPGWYVRLEDGFDKLAAARRYQATLYVTDENSRFRYHLFAGPLAAQAQGQKLITVLEAKDKRVTGAVIYVSAQPE
jgi:hypothetical protein